MDNISPAGRRTITILKVVGLWQWDRNIDGSGAHWLKRLQLFYRYALHFPLNFTFVGLMWVAALTSEDLEEVGNVVYISFTEVTLIVKTINLWLTDARAWHFINEVRHAPAYALKTKDERQMWQDAQHPFNRIWLFFWLSATSIGFMTCIGVLFSSTYKLPFPYWVPFEWRNPELYRYAYWGSCLGIAFTATCNVFSDLIIMYMPFHTSLIYKLIGMRLENLHGKSDQQIKEELVDIIKLHQRAKRLTTECEKLVSAPVLSQIIFSSFILCFSGYRLQKIGASDPVQFLSTLQFVCIMTGQIMLPCYYANEITINADKLINCAYNSGWLHFSVPNKKLLYYFMEMMKKPVCIKAGNFFNVGLPVFVRTINNAYSLFAILLNMDT